MFYILGKKRAFQSIDDHSQGISSPLDGLLYQCRDSELYRSGVAQLVSALCTSGRSYACQSMENHNRDKPNPNHVTSSGPLQGQKLRIPCGAEEPRFSCRRERKVVHSSLTARDWLHLIWSRRMFSVDRGAVLEVFASVAYSAPKIFSMSPKVPDSPVPVVGLQS